MNEEYLDSKIEEIVNYRNSEKSETDIETFKSIKELKDTDEQVSDQQIVINLDDINEKERNDPRAHAVFKRSRH